MSQTIKRRMTQKVDTTTNWEKATSFVPLKGEFIIYQDEGTADRIKIGDGETLVNDLPFVEMGEGTNVTTPIVTTKTIVSGLNERLSPAQTIQLGEKIYSFYEMGSSSPTSYLVFEDGFILEEVGAIKVSYDDMDAVVTNKGEYFNGYCGPSGEDVHIAVTLPDELVEKYADRKLYWSTATVTEETVIENKPISELIPGDNITIDYDNGKAILSSIGGGEGINGIDIITEGEVLSHLEEIKFSFMGQGVEDKVYYESYTTGYSSFKEPGWTPVVLESEEGTIVNYLYYSEQRGYYFECSQDNNNSYARATIRFEKPERDNIGSFTAIELHDGLTASPSKDDPKAVSLNMNLRNNSSFTESFREIAEMVDTAQNDIANVQEDLKTTQALSSQGRSSKYNITEGAGWYRILNLIRASNGTVTIGFGQSNRPLTNEGCGRSSQALAFDFTGYVWYPGQDKNNIAEDIGKPEFLLKYNNLFGDPNAMEKGMAQITKVRLGYPDVAADDWKNGGEQFDNPVNCFLDVYIDFPNPTVATDDGPEQININYTGYANSHKTSLIESCTKVAEDAKGGLEGSEYSLKYYTLDVKDMPTVSHQEETIEVGNDIYYGESFSEYKEIEGTDTQKTSLQYNGRYNLLYRGLPAETQSDTYTFSTGTITYNEEGYYMPDITKAENIWTNYGKGSSTGTDNNRFFFFSSLVNHTNYGGVETAESPLYAPSMFITPGSYYLGKGTALLFNYGTTNPGYGSYGTRVTGSAPTGQRWQHRSEDINLSGTIIDTDKTLECVAAVLKMPNPEYYYEADLSQSITTTENFNRCYWASDKSTTQYAPTGYYTVKRFYAEEGNTTEKIMEFTDGSYVVAFWSWYDPEDQFSVGTTLYIDGLDIYGTTKTPIPYIPMLIKREGIFAELASHEIDTTNKTVTFKNSSGNVIKVVPISDLQIPLYTDTPSIDAASIYYKPEVGKYTTAAQTGIVTINSNDNPIRVINDKATVPVIFSEKAPTFTNKEVIWASPAGDSVIERGEGNGWFYEKWFSGYCELYGIDITKDFPFAISKEVRFTSTDGTAVEVKGWWK